MLGVVLASCFGNVQARSECLAVTTSFLLEIRPVINA